MEYVSTRGKAPHRSLQDLLVRGTAEDGGLYVPDHWPTISKTGLDELSEAPYGEIARRVLALFGGPAWPDAELGPGIVSSLDAFDEPTGPPLSQLATGLWSLELFHGPTFAFKDYALAPLAEIIGRKLAKDEKTVTVLCATSGDTGAATAAAFADRAGARAVIIFPEGRVSDIQRRQMTTLGASNVLPLSVRGDFDDCQAIIKQLYQSTSAKENNYTAVNSINLVRILLQTAYYLYSARAVSRATGGRVNFVVPTGNFGNVFAGYIAKRLGAPIDKLIVSSNDNDVLPRLFETGRMSSAATTKTISPSMDIQIPSNFERMLWLLKDRDGGGVTDAQAKLVNDGGYALSETEMARLKDQFGAVRCHRQQALDAMRWLDEKHAKIICPHTATAYHAARIMQNQVAGPLVVIETAHPAKFPDAVRGALSEAPATPQRLAAVLSRKETVKTVEATLTSVQNAIDEAFSG